MTMNLTVSATCLPWSAPLGRPCCPVPTASKLPRKGENLNSRRRRECGNATWVPYVWVGLQKWWIFHDIPKCVLFLVNMMIKHNQTSNWHKFGWYHLVLPLCKDQSSIDTLQKTLLFQLGSLSFHAVRPHSLVTKGRYPERNESR